MKIPKGSREPEKKARKKRRGSRRGQFAPPPPNGPRMKQEPAAEEEEEGQQEQQEASLRFRGSSPRELGGEDAMPVRMVCTRCERPVFHARKKGSPTSPGGVRRVCRCDGGGSLYYGYFWQEPHPGDPGRVRTHTCLRAEERSWWGSMEMARDAFPDVSTMVVKLPDLRQFFDVRGGAGAVADPEG